MANICGEGEELGLVPWHPHVSDLLLDCPISSSRRCSALICSKRAGLKALFFVVAFYFAWSGPNAVLSPVVGPSLLERVHFIRDRQNAVFSSSQ